MKITKRQLRRIIKEESIAALRESYMKQRYGEIENAILMTLEDSPGLSGIELAATIGDDYPENPNEMPLENEEVFSILDVMIEEDQVFFDTQEDAWYIAGSPEALAAIGDYDAESEFIGHGIRGREMSKSRR